MPPRKTKPKAKSAGLEPDEVADESPPAKVKELAEAVEADGGRVLARYRDPLGGHWLVLAALPIDKVAPTPFQRELSDSHAKRLVGVIPKVGRFLDPLIAVRADGERLLDAQRHAPARGHAPPRRASRSSCCWCPRWRSPTASWPSTPRRRTTSRTSRSRWCGWPTRWPTSRPGQAAGERLGLRVRGAGLPDHRPRLRRAAALLGRRLPAGGEALRGVLRQADRKANELRTARAARLLELDDEVNELVAALKAAGLKSAYLKPFVVARLNPLRFVPAARGKKKAEAGPATSTRPWTQMFARGEKFDAAKIRPQDLASMGGAPPEPDE